MIKNTIEKSISRRKRRFQFLKISSRQEFFHRLAPKKRVLYTPGRAKQLFECIFVCLILILFKKKCFLISWFMSFYVGTITWVYYFWVCFFMVPFRNWVLYLIFYEFSILWCCFSSCWQYGFLIGLWMTCFLAFRIMILLGVFSVVYSRFSWSFYNFFHLLFFCCFFFVFSSLSTTTRQWNLCLRYLLHMLVEVVHRNYDKTKNVGRDKVETGRHRKWVF